MRVRLERFACASAGRAAPGKGEDTYTCIETKTLAMAIVADGASSVDTKDAKALKSSWASGSLASAFKRVAADLDTLEVEDEELPYGGLQRALHMLDHVVSGGVDLYYSMNVRNRLRTLLGIIISLLRGQREGSSVLSASTLAAVVLKPSWIVTLKAGDSHMALHFIPDLPGEEAKPGDWRKFLIDVAKGSVTTLPELDEDSMITIRFTKSARSRMSVETPYVSAPMTVLTEGVLAAAYLSGYRCVAGVVASDGAKLNSYLITARTLQNSTSGVKEPLTFYIPDPASNERLAEVLDAYPQLRESLLEGMRNLAANRLYVAMKLTFSHLTAVAACHALRTGSLHDMKGLLEAIVETGYRKKRDDASVAVVVAELTGELGDGDEG